MSFTFLGMGGGMLVSGLLNAVVSSINSRANAKMSASQQVLNRDCQVAQQNKQWKHAEMLQEKMREATRQNLLLQLKQQMDMLDYQQLDKHWPLLSCSPYAVTKEINDHLRAGEPIPLQLIVVENGDLSKGPLAIHGPVQNAITELNKFISRYYGLNTAQGVQVYDRSKPGAEFGAAEVNTLFQVFRSAPTVVLTSRVIGSEYVLECWYWGSGSAEKPVMVEILRCDVEDLQIEILRKIADKWLETKERLGVEDADKDRLVELLERLSTEERRLESRGASPEEVRYYSRKPFRDQISNFTTLTSQKSLPESQRIDPRPFIREINDGIGRRIVASYKICSSLLCDAHFLLERKVQPKFLMICDRELQDAPELLEQSRSLFEGMINALPSDSINDKALMYARMAGAYQTVNLEDAAMTCSSKCVKLLESMVSPEEFAFEASAEMKDCITELKHIPAAMHLVPWLGTCDRNVSDDELNRHAASMYQKGNLDEALSIWRRAAERGHLKSMHNLGMVLESVKRVEEARAWLTKAVLLGYESLYSRGYELAWRQCVRGSWPAAFRLWNAYLISKDGAHRDEAMAYSALILSTAALTELSEADCRLWLQTISSECPDIDAETSPAMDSDIVYPEVAMKALAALAKRNNGGVFLAALGLWIRRSLNDSHSLFPGIEDSYELIYLPQQDFSTSPLRTLVKHHVEPYEQDLLLKAKLYHE